MMIIHKGGIIGGYIQRLKENCKGGLGKACMPDGHPFLAHIMCAHAHCASKGGRYRGGIRKGWSGRGERSNFAEGLKVYMFKEVRL